jgi:hypothetical protein
LEFAPVFSLSQLLDEKSAVAYRLGWLGEDRPIFRTRSCYTNLTYRRSLCRHWLFFEITPELLYPRNDDFNINPSLTIPSLTIGVELVLSE